MCLNTHKTSAQHSVADGQEKKEGESVPKVRFRKTCQQKSPGKRHQSLPDDNVKIAPPCRCRHPGSHGSTYQQSTNSTDPHILSGNTSCPFRKQSTHTINILHERQRLRYRQLTDGYFAPLLNKRHSSRVQKVTPMAVR